MMAGYPTDSSRHRQTRPELWCLLIITLAVGSIFGQCIGFDFIALDDGLYVFENPHVIQGLTPASVHWAWTTFTAGNWHPLTWLSLMTDVELFGGISAGGHHAINLFIHWLNAILVFAVFRYTTGAVWRSLFCALIFAVHPLRVESVIWVAERKDVLSAAFGLAALSIYCQYARRPAAGRYAIALGLFAASLLAKPMWVTFPFLLLLMDYWPLDRWSGCRRVRLVMEKIPFLSLAIGASIMAVVSQQSSGAVKALIDYPVSVRIANAVIAYVKYLLAFLWPTNLALVYPHPGHHPAWQTLACGIVLATITAILWWGVRRPYLIVGWFWYLGSLVPVIGIVQIGGAELADRYTYIPQIGIALMAAWTWQGLAQRLVRQRQAAPAAAAAWVVALAAAAWCQTGLWGSTETIMTHTLQVTRNNYMIHNNLGFAEMNAGRIDEAMDHFKAALAIRPGYLPALDNLGAAYERQGRMDKAIAIFTRIVSHRPDYTKGLTNLGNTYENAGDLEHALTYYRRALEQSPTDGAALLGLGRVHYRQGDFSDALTRFNEALDAMPDNAGIQNYIGATLIMLGKPEAARRWLQDTLARHPDSADTYYYLGELMRRSGRPDTARKMFSLAINLSPTHDRARAALAEIQPTPIPMHEPDASQRP